MSVNNKRGEVFEDLANEVEDELLLETFIDLNPDIKRLGNVNNEDSDFARKRRAEEN